MTCRFMPSTFLSYAREDRAIAERLHTELTRVGLDVWIDFHDLVPGQNWKAAIRRAIRESTFFLALMSSRSLSKRGFVQKELRLAFEVMDELPPERIFLIPIRIDVCEPQEERICEVQWLDLFPSWDSAIAKLVSVIRPPTGDREKTANVARFARCRLCDAPISDSADRCTGCGAYIEPPNVRRALAERQVLEARYMDAVSRAKEAGHSAIVSELQKHAKNSKAVISIDLRSLHHILVSGGLFLQRFLPGLRADEKEADRLRLTVGGVLFGAYGSDIRYAVLSTTGRGLRRYGSAWIVLKDISVEQRATVLERNSVGFLKGHLLTRDLPKGHISVWSDRDKLAVAKLAPLLHVGDRPKDGEWLLREDANSDDFMEVHIYGPIDVHAIESITVVRSGRTIMEKALITEMSHLATEKGIKFKMADS